MEKANCEEHEENEARLWYETCEKMICTVCIRSDGKHSSNDGHKLGSLEEAARDVSERFRREKREFDRRLHALDAALGNAMTDKDTFDASLFEVKEIINEKAKSMIALIEWYRNKQLETAETVATDVRREREDVIKSLEGKLGPLCEMDQLNQTFPTMSSLKQLQICNLMKGIRLDTVGEPQLPDIAQPSASKDVRLLCHDDDPNITIAPVIRRSIGQPYLALSENDGCSSVEEMLPEFCCSSDPESVVLDIMASSTGTVFVAYSTKEGDGQRSDRWVAEYTREGKLLERQLLPGKKDVKIVPKIETKIWVISQVEQGIKSEQSKVAKSDRSARPLYSLQKGRGVNVFKVMETRRPMEPPVSLFDITVHSPSKINANEEGANFAVLHCPPHDEASYSSRDKKTNTGIKIFKRGERTSSGKFLPSAAVSELTDVCFVLAGRTELLLVSDSINNCIYEVDYQHGCRLRRTITSACGLMMTPTALATDGDGTVWVGCKGGQLLIYHVTERRNTPTAKPRHTQQVHVERHSTYDVTPLIIPSTFIFGVQRAVSNYLHLANDSAPSSTDCSAGSDCKDATHKIQSAPALPTETQGMMTQQSPQFLSRKNRATLQKLQREIQADKKRQTDIGPRSMNSILPSAQPFRQTGSGGVSPHVRLSRTQADENDCEPDFVRCKPSEVHYANDYMNIDVLSQTSKSACEAKDGEPKRPPPLPPRRETNA